MPERTTSRTDANLQVALAGEADANRRYLAYGLQAINENFPEIAQLFLEAAGAETVHALTHLRTMGAVGSTRENLERAATGEIEEIDVILPRMIHDAEQEGRHDAAASFRLALERERHHRDMFRAALAAFERGLRAPRSSAGAPLAPGAPREAAHAPITEPAYESFTARANAPATARTKEAASPAAGARVPAGVSIPSGPVSPGLPGGDGRAHATELDTEPERIERLSSIREIVFGAQDGLLSTFVVVAGLAAAGADHLVIMIAGAVSAAAGVLAMSIGTYLSSRALRQVYEAELAHERREIREHPGEEISELIAALAARGMSRGDAVEVGRRIARHPDLLLDMLGLFELGLAPQRLGTPVRDAFVMALAFGGAALVPVLPFLASHVMAALSLAAALTVIALFIVGAVKGRAARVSAVRSGLEVVVLGLVSGVIGFGLGRLVSIALGVDIGG
jgi:vacuolar iron transporter family protein